MKIGFAGAGAVGCHYGSKLIQAEALQLPAAANRMLTSLVHAIEQMTQ